MNTEAIHIVPHKEAYNGGALAMEKAVVQGRHVQLEIVKAHFLDRARAFENYYACLAVNDHDQVIASSVAAKTVIRVNGRELNAGIAFDTKVDKRWRKKGIGHQLARHLYSQFFATQQLDNVFMTAKLSNGPVLNLARKMEPGSSLYPFVYLAIPAHARLKIKPVAQHDKQLFHVYLFNAERLPAHYYQRFSNGLGCFYTSRMYVLKIKKISFLFKSGMAIMKFFSPAKYARLPAEGSEISFAVLYDHTATNIHGINEVLERLQTEKIDQLLVCCRKNDAVHKSLQSIAIYSYDYCLLSDFTLQNTDELTIDARCL